MSTDPRPSAPRPDLPAAARLMEAARAYRMAARQLRRGNPPRRAESQQARVEVAADGRPLLLEVLQTRPATATALATHLIDLYRLATASAAVAPVGVVLSDLDHDPAAPHSCGPRRFQFPAGVDDQAAPEVVMAQLRQRFARRWASAESMAQRTAELVGTATHEGIITIRVQAHGVLALLTLRPEVLTMSVPAINQALAETLTAAQDDLRRRIDEALEGSRNQEQP